MWIELISYAAIGALAGTLSGLLGIGGGIIIVPLLAMVYNLQHIPDNIVMHMAIATSLTAMIFTTSSAVFAHYRYGSHIGTGYRLLAPGAAIGAIVGAVLAHKLSSNTLQVIFGFFVLLIAIRLIFQGSTPSKRHLPPKIINYFIAFFIGIVASLLGLGGGTFIVPYLAFCNVNMRDAVGISASCSLTIAVVSTLSFMTLGFFHVDLPGGSTGYIFWPAVACIAITSPFFALWGAKLSYSVPVKRLRQIFAVFLLGVAIYML